MATGAEPWPCPSCAELIPVGLHDCPYCRMSAGWIDQLLALDFTIRRFHLCNLVGALSKEQYRGLVACCRQRREDMIRAAQAGRPAPLDSGLPLRAECWSCGRPCQPSARYCAGCNVPVDTPEVRLFRYQTFLGQEIKGHEKAGRISAAQANQLRGEITQSLTELRDRLTAAMLPSRS
jgi:hypothetical protein